jgi:two-component system KDP operon response regulator KdpE
MTTTATVLVVGEDARNQRNLKSSLSAAGYACVVANSGAEALRLIATRAPDIAVLDAGLPDMDGKELVRQVRGWSEVPIIILSDGRRPAEEIAALDLGADDYVGRPFNPGGLLARIRKALRHRARTEAEAAVFSSSGLVVDTLARTVTRDGVLIRLTAREFDVLVFLMRHAGRVVTHRQMLEAVWDSAHAGHTQYLRVFIGRLRQKIEVTPNDPKLLMTIQGVGYRLEALR